MLCRLQKTNYVSTVIRYIRNEGGLVNRMLGWPGWGAVTCTQARRPDNARYKVTSGHDQWPPCMWGKLTSPTNRWPAHSDRRPMVGSCQRLGNTKQETEFWMCGNFKILDAQSIWVSAAFLAMLTATGCTSAVIKSECANLQICRQLSCEIVHSETNRDI